MRRSLSLLVAAAVAASTFSFAPVQARALAPLPAIGSDGGSITKVGDRGHRWKHRRHANRHWKHHRRHHARRHHHRDRHYSSLFPFAFVAPFAFAPRHTCYGRLVYGYDGRLHCVPYY
jgi:hypothetical protein